MNQGQTAAYETQYQQMEQHVLMMGNNILAALNADEVVTDVQIFQMDIFYIQIFQEIFGENLGLQPGQTPAQMAENIDALLNMIEDAIPDINIETLNGDMIVEGDFSQIVMMLELVAELIRLTDVDDVLGEGEEDEDEQAKLLQMQAEEELKKKQEEIMQQNDQNSMGIRTGQNQVAHGDPRDILRARKKERQNKEQTDQNKSAKNSAKKPGTSPTKQKQAPVSKNPLDQFAAQNPVNTQNNPQLNQFGADPLSQFGTNPLSQFGNQPQLNQFGNQPQLNQFGNQPQLNQFGNQPQLNQFGNPALNQFNSGSGGGGLVPFGQVSQSQNPLFNNQMIGQPFGGSSDPLAAPTSGFQSFMPGQSNPIGGGGDAYAFDINLDVPKEIKIPPEIPETEPEQEEEETESDQIKDEIEDNKEESNKLLEQLMNDDDNKPHVWGGAVDEAMDIDGEEDEPYSDTFEATIEDNKQKVEVDKSPQKDMNKEDSVDKEYKESVQKQKDIMNNTESYIGDSSQI